jgi:hypothetical protein
MDIKWNIVIGVIKRIALPMAVGSLVLWLMSHGYDDWVPVICGTADNLGIAVTECNDGS